MDREFDNIVIPLCHSGVVMDRDLVLAVPSCSWIHFFFPICACEVFIEIYNLSTCIITIFASNFRTSESDVMH